jgi:glycosyltransferase involved in cell wall biosynthesis
MHICFLCNEFPLFSAKYGGIGIFVDTISKELVGLDHTVSVVGIGQDEHNKVVSLDRRLIIQLKKSKWKFASFIDNSIRLNSVLYRVNRLRKISIIEGQENSFAFILFEKKAKRIIRMHGGHFFFTKSENKKISWWKAFQEIISFKKADGFLSVSDYVSRITQRYIDIGNKPVKTIYNSINTKQFRVTDPLISKEGLVLFIGTITPKKGVKQLLLAFRMVIKKFPNANLVLIGRDRLHNGLSYIDSLTLEFEDIREYFKFLGSINNKDLPTYIESASVCCCPSLMESFGIIWGEILAMGKPLIASKTGPGPEVVKDGVTGILCDPNSPEDIASKIVHLMSNPDLARKLGNMGRVDILERFSAEHIVAKNVEFYKMISK